MRAGIPNLLTGRLDNIWRLQIIEWSEGPHAVAQILQFVESRLALIAEADAVTRAHLSNIELIPACRRSFVWME